MSPSPHVHLTGLVDELTSRSDSQQTAEVIAAFVHDMRTPLVASAQLLELSLEDNFGKLPAETRQVVDAMLRSNKGMQRLLNTLADLFEVTSRNAPFNSTACEKLTVRTIIEKAAEQCRGDVDCHISVDVDSALTVLGVPDHLEKLFSMLILYSVDPRSHNHNLSISAHRHNDRIKITISGCALTLPKLDHAAQFKNVCHADIRRKLPASAGPALFLCGRIVEACNGDLSANSHEDGTTTFEVVLPAAS